MSVRGLLGWSIGLLLGLYVCGVTSWIVWQRQRPYNFVSYTDAVLLPVRWPQVREALGRSMIQGGLEDLRRKRWSEGEMKLKTGLGRAPRELRGRLALAQFYVATNRLPLALQLLADGLGPGHPGRDYLTTFFELAGKAEDFDQVVALCDRYLPGENSEHVWLVTQKLKALIAAQRWADALACAGAEGDGAAPDIIEAKVLALLGLDRGADALRVLEDWRTRSAMAQAQMLRLRVRAYRQTGQFAAMDMSMQELQQFAPAEPRVYALAVTENISAGRLDLAEARLRDYLWRFGAQARAISGLAAELAELRQPALVRVCVNEAAAHGFPMLPFLQLQAEAELRAGEWGPAARSLAGLRKAIGPGTPVDIFHLKWLELLLAACQPGGGGDLPLVELVQSQFLPLRIFRDTGATLLLAGRPEVAANVLLAAVKIYPASPSLAAIRADGQRQIELRKSRATLVAGPAASTETEEGPFFGHLAGLMERGDWQGADDIVHKVRVEKPRWFGAREADVLMAQVRVSSHIGDVGEITASVRYLLAGDLRRSPRILLEIAREFHARGAKREAQLVLEEILIRLPEFGPAKQLLAEWKPKKN